MERSLVEIAPGAEVVLVIKDPDQRLAVWLRGWISHGRVVDLNPLRSLDIFDIGRRAESLKIVNTENIEFRGAIRCRTFTMGWPTAEQLAKPIPIDFDPDYFRSGP